jgi:hypothetical protein
MLGAFLGLRGRHMLDTGRTAEAELDYLLARRLYPNSRLLHMNATSLAIRRGPMLFEPGELGSPQSFAEWIIEAFGAAPVTPASAGDSLAVLDTAFTAIF